MIDYTAMAEQLSGEYRTIFEKVQLYSDMNGIQEEMKADRMMNLLDLLTTAEAEQKPASEIIGSDIHKFCKDYFADYDIHIKISEIPEKIYNLARVLIVVLLLDIFLLDHSPNILPMIAGILVGALLAILLKYLVGPVIYRSKRIPAMVYYVLVILLFITFIVISMYIVGDQSLQLPSFPFLVVSISYIVIYLTVRSIIRYRKTGSIRKPKLVDSEFEFHLPKAGADSKDLENAAQKGLVKRYQRINKSRSRRNQPTMTTQEFIQKVRTEDAIICPICIWGLGITYIAMVAGIIIDNIRNFGVGFHSLILLAVLSAIYIPIFLFIRYCILQGARVRKNILTAWETQGITLLEQKTNHASDAPENLQD